MKPRVVTGYGPSQVVARAAKGRAPVGCVWEPNGIDKLSDELNILRCYKVSVAVACWIGILWAIDLWVTK